MANPNNPFGAMPRGLYGAVQPTMGLGTAKISAGNTTPIFRGDLLLRVSTGPTSGFVSQWQKGTAASAFVGIFWGAKYLSQSQGKTIQNQFWPGNDAQTDATCYFIPCIGSPAPLLFIQSGNSTSPVAFGNVGNNIDVNVTPGSIIGAYGKSNMVADVTTIGAANTLPFRIAGFLSDFMPAGTPGTDNTSANNIIAVYANVAGETGI